MCRYIERFDQECSFERARKRLRRWAKSAKLLNRGRKSSGSGAQPGATIEWRRHGNVLLVINNNRVVTVEPYSKTPRTRGGW